MSVVQAPYSVFLDTFGNPVESGFLYFGTENKNPKVESNRITVYWDSSFTTPAAQPVRTLSGVPVRNGSPANIHVKETKISVSVYDKNDVLLNSELSFQLCLPSSIGSRQPFPTLAAFRAAVDLYEGEVVHILDRPAPYLMRAVTAAADDGGSVIKSTGVPALEGVAQFVTDVYTSNQWGLTGASTGESVKAQAAINYITSVGGGTFVITGTPTATYYLNVVIPSNVHICGGHRGVTIKPETNTAVIKLSQTDNCVRSKISNLIIDGTTTKATFTSQDGILLQPASSYFHDSITIEDCHVKDCGRYGIAAIGVKPTAPSQFVQHLSVYRTKITDCIGAGLKIQGTVLETYIEACNINDNGDKNTSSNSNVTIHLNGSEAPLRVKVLSGVINTTIYGALGYSVAVLGGKHISFDSIDFENFNSAFLLQNALNENIAVRNCNFTKNGSVSSVAELLDVNGFIWENNNIADAITAAAGITIGASATRVKNYLISPVNSWGGLTTPLSAQAAATISNGVVSLTKHGGIQKVLGQGSVADDLYSLFGSEGGIAEIVDGTIISLQSSNNTADVTIKDSVSITSRTITGITQASPAVVTSTGHGYPNGTAVYISGVLGMTEINNGVYIVANTAANTYELTGINSTSYTAYTSGGTSETPKGKFHCAGDFTLSHKQDRIAFQWDQTEAAWCEISRSDNTA